MIVLIPRTQKFWFFMVIPEKLQTTNPDVQNTKGPVTPKEIILSQIDKSVVMNTGRVSIYKNNSVWIVDHQEFSSSCPGKVYIVAEAEDGDSFRSVGNSCTGCYQTIPLDIQITRGELERKIEEDVQRERIHQYLEGKSARVTQLDTST